jgi:outer membrane protein OmpA-like peptidoglycan-associated protein
MNKFKTKSDFFRIACIVVLGSNLVGCTTNPAKDLTGEIVEGANIISTLKKGELRLNCGSLGCAMSSGASQQKINKLFTNGLWNDLALEVARIGFEEDAGYYYLGQVAENLGSIDAARVYYKLSLTTQFHCPTNLCNGLTFPQDANKALERIEKLTIAAKAPTYTEKTPIFSYDTNFVNPLNLKSLPDTVSFEHTARINRLEQLSNQLNTPRPTIEQIQVKTPSANFPIPVIRFHFDERTFFDSGSSMIRPESNKIIDMLAEQMKQDMPDTSLIILGHTDSVGSDENNNNLSINRSASVMQQLAQRGVNLKQMSTVGIGEAQPVATNATEDGRSQNRRVEFVLSRFEEANYVAIEQFPRNTEWLNNHPETQVEIEPIIQEKLPVKTKQVVHVQPKAMSVVHHNTEAKKLVVFKPTKEMLVKSNSETTGASEPTTMLKESTRTVTIIPAETVHIIPQTLN